MMIITAIHVPGCDFFKNRKHVSTSSAVALPVFHCDADTVSTEEGQSIPEQFFQPHFLTTGRPANDGTAYFEFPPDGVVFAWIPDGHGFPTSPSDSFNATKYSAMFSQQLDMVPNSHVKLKCQIWFLENGSVFGSLMLDDIKLPNIRRLDKTTPNAVFMAGNDGVITKGLMGSFMFEIVGNNFAVCTGGLFEIPLADIWNDLSFSSEDDVTE